MQQKIIHNLQEALRGKKLIRVAHTLDEGLEQTILPLPQEIWYKYPTLGEDFLKIKFPCFRPFQNRDRDRQYTYDHILWKMMAMGYLEKMGEEPLFFSFKNSTNLSEACEEFGFKELMTDYKLYKDLQYKNRLYFYGVDEEHGQIPFVEKKLEETSYQELAEALGEKFVVQFSFSHMGWNTSGGRDTYFIENEKDFLHAQKDERGVAAKISRYIKGPSFAVTAVATEKGTFVSDYFLQIIGCSELVASPCMYCGVDFTKCRPCENSAQKQIYDITKYVGAKIYGKNFKGIFGIDFVVDQQSGKVYVLEINPRFCGSTYMINFLFERAGKLAPIALHFAEYLDSLPESFNIEEYEQDAKDVMTGSFLYIRNREGKELQIKSAPKPGVYRIEGDGIVFEKEGYKIGDLHDTGQLLIRRISPLQRNIGPFETICKLETLDSVLQDEKTLSKEYARIVRLIYSQFEFVPAGTYDSSVPYDAM